MKHEAPDDASSPDPNPYIAPDVLDIPPQASQKAGPVAIFFGFIIASTLAAAAFGLSFFFTCLGVMSIGGDGDFAMVLIWGISGLTTIAAFVFSLWGFLKIVEGFKRR